VNKFNKKLEKLQLLDMGLLIEIMRPSLYLIKSQLILFKIICKYLTNDCSNS
jgi:hypothetical protein